MVFVLGIFCFLLQSLLSLVHVPQGSPMCTVSMGPLLSGFQLGIYGRYQAGNQKAGGMGARYLFPFSVLAKFLQIVCMPLPMIMILLRRPSPYRYPLQILVTHLAPSGLDVLIVLGQYTILCWFL